MLNDINTLRTDCKSGIEVRTRLLRMVESKSANPLNVFNGHSEKSVEFSLKGLNRLFDDSERVALAPVTHRHDADDCDSHGEQHHRQQPSNTGDCPRQPYFFVP